MEDGALRMRMREHLRRQVCGRTLRGEASEREAAGRLDLSARQVRRLKKRVAVEGPGGVIHRLWWQGFGEEDAGGGSQACQGAV